MAWGKFLWKQMNLSHVPGGHWGNVRRRGFKRLSAQIEFLGVGRVDATAQRKRELWNWVTLGDVSSRQAVVSRDALLLKPGEFHRLHHG